MTRLRVVGIDPGPQPGLCLLRFGISTPWWPVTDVRAIQCDAASAPDVLRYLLDLDNADTNTIVGCERFVRGNRSAKAAHPGAVTKTQRMITQFQTIVTDWLGQSVLDDRLGRWVLNNASRVKAWAKYERLDAAGLTEPTKGMTHSRDSAKHALFVARNEGGAPDPLSRKGC